LSFQGDQYAFDRLDTRQTCDPLIPEQNAKMKGSPPHTLKSTMKIPRFRGLSGDLDRDTLHVNSHRVHFVPLAVFLPERNEHPIPIEDLMKKNILHLTLLTLVLPLIISGARANNKKGDETPLSPAEKLVQSIVKKGYKRVAVLPRVVSRTTGHMDAVTGSNSVGALSMAWPDELYDALVEASLNSDGKFAVVSDQQVLQALKGKKVDDVGSEEMWNVIKDKTGADYLASIDVTDPGAAEGRTGSPEIKRVVNGVDLNTKSAAGRVTQVYSKSLTDGAYAGESFVVREWQGNKLAATGLSGGRLFDTGASAEKDQYSHLVPQEHPLLRQDYPYGISIEVNGQKREPKLIGDKLVVTLDLGEEYVVRAWNHGEREVFMGLFIDGVNSIGAKIERPDTTPTNRNWFIAPDPNDRKISGWQKIDPNTQESTYEKFIIVNSQDSVAKEEGQPGGDGFSDSLGMITALFYSYGMDDIPQTKGTTTLATDNIGTGRGEKQEGGTAGFDPNAKQKGLLLSSMTIYYRSSKWLEEHPNGLDTSAVAEGPKPETQIPDEPKPSKTETEQKQTKPKDSENDLPE